MEIAFAETPIRFFEFPLEKKIKTWKPLFSRSKHFPASVGSAGQTLTTTGILLSPTNSPLIEHSNQEVTMREVQLGAHTLRSHGVSVARKHMHDWLILLLLLVLEIILFVIHPFYRFVGKDMMSDLKYPLKSNTVPVWAVPIYSVMLPMVVFLFIYFRRRDVYDLHHAILGLFFSVLITAVMTDAIKDAVGRPRPDFFWRCFPDGKDDYDALGNVICHGDRDVIKEGHKSFPSGHTSWSFAGLGFLSLYLSGKIQVFDQRGHIAKLCLVFLPLLAASLVGVSRVDDYWHHWQDVFAGGLLGLVIATFCYLQFFPPPYHSEGWGPYAYFKMLEDSGAITSNAAAANAQNGHVMQTQSESHQDDEDEHDHTFMGLALTGRSNSIVEDVEAGRRQ
uniref:Phosphatidic acid phosphatase type 2/haloperoxidase domain-containing protein n=1 Tax=Kalanchoe fedtschenkoi TaxID=63787 RepID=A0A7N0T982_KALFE